MAENKVLVLGAATENLYTSVHEIWRNLVISLRSVHHTLYKYKQRPLKANPDLNSSLKIKFQVTQDFCTHKN